MKKTKQNKYFLDLILESSEFIDRGLIDKSDDVYLHYMYINVSL